MDSLTINLESLRNDKAVGSYYYGWQSNIAMAFYDTYWHKIEGRESAPTGEEIHEIANTAAKRFLDQLCYEPEPDAKAV